MNDCDGCKWWSELCAYAIGGEPMKAMCLNPDSLDFQRMKHAGCDKYEAGRAIDDPVLFGN